MRDICSTRLRLEAARQLRDEKIGVPASIYLEGLIDALEWALGESDELPLTAHDIALAPWGVP
jgi:hypothetical protein